MQETIDAPTDAVAHAATLPLPTMPPPAPSASTRPALLPPPAEASSSAVPLAPAPAPAPLAAPTPRLDAPTAFVPAPPPPPAPVPAAPVPAAPVPAAPVPAAPVPAAPVAAAPVPADPEPAPAPVATAPITTTPITTTPITTTPITTGPSAIFSVDAAIVPAEHATPMLPTNTPAVPSAAPPTTASAFDVEDFLGAANTDRKKQQSKPRGRWFFRLVLIGLLGGGGWLASQHGPELYDQYANGEEASGPTETTAPLAFPNVPAASAIPIRTAEFVLVGLPETPGATYRVTTDFETSVSQVDITRDTGPALQILTYGDDAMIRQADGDQWYLLDRGQFPLDGRLERSDWVRRIDELLPATVRDQAIIDESTEAVISGVPTRHLTLTVDPVLLDAASADPSTTIAAASNPAEPDSAVPDSSAPESPGSESAVPDSAVPDSAGSDSAGSDVAATGAPGAAPTISLEVWIDGDGLVRQVVGAPQLGAETITVVRTTGDAWIPTYPTPAEIAPLTASALVDLGL